MAHVTHLAGFTVTFVLYAKPYEHTSTRREVDYLFIIIYLFIYLFIYLLLFFLKSGSSSGSNVLIGGHEFQQAVMKLSL